MILPLLGQDIIDKVFLLTDLSLVAFVFEIGALTEFIFSRIVIFKENFIRVFIFICF